MNVKIISIVVLVLALVGGGAFFALSGSDDTETSQSTTPESNSRRSSINGLLGLGQQLTCTYEYMDANGNASSGEAVIDGERMRGSFKVTSGDETETSELLRDGETQYVWNDETKEGYQVAISVQQTDVDDPTPDSNETAQGPDQDEQYDFDCQDWSVDETEFEVPGDVNFIDYTAQLEQSLEAQQEAADQAKPAMPSRTLLPNKRVLTLCSKQSLRFLQQINT